MTMAMIQQRASTRKVGGTPPWIQKSKLTFLAEQEKVISDLSTKDAAQTDLFRKIFLLLPVLAALPYIPGLFSPQSPRTFAQSLFCISSLLATAFTLFRHGPILNVAALFSDAASPAFYIPALNAGLSGILALQAALSTKTTLWPPIWVPAVVFWVILVVRYMLRPVDVTGLEKMRYRYKGA